MLRTSSLLQAAAALLLALLPQLCKAKERSIPLLGDIYTESFSSTLNGASIHELTKTGESLSNWTRLLTIQCHPSASRAADVINPYLRSRQDFFLSKPSFLHSPNDGKSGLVLIAVLGQKSDQSFEFVALRFSEQERHGVIAVSLSEKHATAENVRIEDGKRIEDAIVNFDMAFARQVCSERA